MKRNLVPSTLTLFGRLGIHAWVHDGSVRHNGNPEVREEIKENLTRVREGAGVKGSAAYFGAVLLIAMNRGLFTEEDIESLDPLGQGNATYILEKLRG